MEEGFAEYRGLLANLGKQGFGGLEKCQSINREIAQYVDVMIGNEEDFTACLGFEIEGVDENLTDLDVSSFQNMIKKAVATFPNFKATATTAGIVMMNRGARKNDTGLMIAGAGYILSKPSQVPATERES